MFERRSSTILLGAILGAALASVSGASAHTRSHQDPSAPRILLDQPPRAIEYQLSRLTNEELVLVERKPDDPRYRLVYLALLTRKGVPSQFRDEALAALAAMDKVPRSQVLLDALRKVPADDTVTAEKLLTILFAEPATALREQRGVFVKAIEGSALPLVLRAAYGALIVAGGGDGPEAAWQAALKHEGHLLELLRSVPHLPSAGNNGVGAQLHPPIAALVRDTKDSAIRVEALGALGWTRRDAATFDLLAQEVIKGTDPDARAAAVRSLQVIPETAWPAAGIEPLARAIVAKLGELSPDRRTEPPVLDAIQFGERLAARLPGETGRAVRRDLRALGVQVVRIQTLPEKLSFDLRWFAVEAGKPVQIVLVNVDAMPHNLLVSKPGSLQEVGTAGSAMPMPSDPAVKPFVPDSPLVLFSTNLLKEGETERLGLTAPTAPGEYVFVCTFPGHWVRMYGVMLVVDNLEAWEAKPTVPTDPMTKQPFSSQRN
jgi:uncharacterized cupredoxin-like copper-binding protein/DNA-binding transcriptional ArsR family regulator